ncbi:cuticle protein 6-like [Eriocheir sinensis]|uniref:cuticle protein 6-like n=1 Tax=Eriocheir sinensis TaxID=95602 RepID=UPI0021C8608C|nr:cuticle protein 6-like [Eriocheir sinensis]
MNSLTVLSLAAAVVCSTGHLVNYAGLYGYPGIFGAYPGLLAHNYLGAAPYLTAGPVTLKAAPNVPLTYSVAPVAPLSPVAAVAPVAPVAPVQSKYHAQDELGQYSFGYAGGPASRAETRDAYGVVRGSYNYVDPEGKLQTQHYVADALGFRVAGTNLPVAPAAPEAPGLVGPEPVQDTPEVVAAKAAFRMAYDEAAAAAEAAPDTR